MPILGAHMSVAGGLHRAFERIKAVGGQSLQIFTRNQRQWDAPPILREESELFYKAWEESGGLPVVAHGSYLVNLADPDPEKAQRAVAAFAAEIVRASALGIPWLAMHPGFHMGRGVEAGLELFVNNLDRAIELGGAHAGGNVDVAVLLETTAGQGSALGAKFEELAYMLDASRYSSRLGVCYDTCHAFAAGYDIRTPESYGETFSLFDKLIGVKHLKLFHLNDSKKGLGAKRDRHEHIGEGQIGLEAFRLLVNDPRFSHLPMVLETPKENGTIKDKMNLRTLRSLLHENPLETGRSAPPATQASSGRS